MQAYFARMARAKSQRCRAIGIMQFFRPVEPIGAMHLRQRLMRGEPFERGTFGRDPGVKPGIPARRFERGKLFLARLLMRNQYVGVINQRAAGPRPVRAKRDMIDRQPPPVARRIGAIGVQIGGKSRMDRIDADKARARRRQCVNRGCQIGVIAQAALGFAAKPV